MRQLGVLLIGTIAIGCGGGDDGGEADPGVVTASVVWDGDSFTLEAPCAISESGDLRAIDGVDTSRTFGVSIVWNALIARTGEVYETDVLGTLSLHVVRPNPTQAGVRVSSAMEGHAEFIELGTEPGETISGTFDDLLMTRDEVDDMVTVTMTDGMFDCVVPTTD